MQVNERSDDSKTFLQHTQIHEAWQFDYLNADLDRFYDLAFGDILARIQAKPSDTILDAGCGYCYHTLRLARSGAKILGVDFSQAALAAAQRTLAKAGLQSQVTLQQGDLTRLELADNSVDFVVSWGVIMHIPEMEKALGELARVLKVGGTLVLGENNASSVDVTVLEPLFAFAKWLLGRPQPDVRYTRRGKEAWTKTSSGGLMVRKTDMHFLKDYLAGHGLLPVARIAGQFTEAYTNVPTRSLKRLVYRFNEFYFRHLRWPSPAMGNILFFRKG